MKHLSWKYRRRRNPQEQREFNRAQAGRIARRWEKKREAMAGERIRATRTVRITIEDSHRMRVVLVLSRDETPVGWGRAQVVENGRPCKRKWGVRRLATRLAELLR